jgi:hypothetical protein
MVAQMHGVVPLFALPNARVDRAAASKVSISKPLDPRLRVQRFVRRSFYDSVRYAVHIRIGFIEQQCGQRFPPAVLPSSVAEQQSIVRVHAAPRDAIDPSNDVIPKVSETELSTCVATMEQINPTKTSTKAIVE